jgi:hypothetical protein
MGPAVAGDDRNPHRAHAASIRMEALARLIEEHPLQPVAV